MFTDAADGAQPSASTSSRSRSNVPPYKSSPRDTGISKFANIDQSGSSALSTRGINTTSRDSSFHTCCSTTPVDGSDTPRSTSARRTSFSTCTRRSHTCLPNFFGVRTNPKNPSAPD